MQQATICCEYKVLSMTRETAHLLSLSVQGKYVMYIMGLMFMIISGAICGLFGFIQLHETGAPFWGYAIAGSVACFVGGWVILAEQLSEE